MDLSGITHGFECILVDVFVDIKGVLSWFPNMVILAAQMAGRTYFVPNLVACIPPQLIEAIAAADVCLENEGFTGWARFWR